VTKSKSKVVAISSNSDWDSTAASATWEAQKSKAKSKWGSFTRCYHTHPGLPITDHNGHTRVVFGGSCSEPIHEDANIYVGLDYNMAEHKQRFPWEHGAAIHFKIQDMGVPKNPTEFKSLINYLVDQILGGLKVHIGCIGGHGRTGIVLAALVATMTDEEDAITYVRKHYCKKAVESAKQVEFLMKHFGCKEVVGAKVWKTKKTVGKTSKALKATINPVFAKHCIFGELDVDP
jgi:protein-tyrosine phosphatase